MNKLKYTFCIDLNLTDIIASSQSLSSNHYGYWIFPDKMTFFFCLFIAGSRLFPFWDETGLFGFEGTLIYYEISMKLWLTLFKQKVQIQGSLEFFSYSTLSWGTPIH